MKDNSDHTVLITVCVLVGIVLTVTVAIIGSVYNNNRNIERDNHLIDRCQQVVKEQYSNWTTTYKYRCGGKS